MSTEAPWEVIRAAADRLESLAARTSQSPWADYVNGIVWSADGDPVVSELTPRDGEWIATVSPAVAEPLVAWLRAAADSLEVHVPVWEEPEPRIHPRRTRGEVDRLIGHHFGHALELSRLILGGDRG